MNLAIATLLLSLSAGSNGFVLSPTFGAEKCGGPQQRSNGDRTSQILKMSSVEQPPSFFDHIPSKETTNLDVDITRLCASISNRLYTANDISDFNVNPDVMKGVEPFLFDNHGDLAAGTSPFAAVVAGKTLIISWRGSHSPMDFVNDSALSPQSSIALRHLPAIKMQGAFTGIVQNDIVLHEDKLITLINEKEIEEIVTTGHSLGGGAAVVAHVIIRGQMDVESPWAALKGKVKISTLSFEGPMTVLPIINTKEYPDEANLLASVSKSTFTTAYADDIVPRGYGHLGFIEDFTEDALEGTKFKSKHSIGRLFNVLADRSIDKMLDLGMKKTGLDPLKEVAASFRHVGKVLYYADKVSEPKVLDDTGKSGSHDKGSFRYTGYHYKDEKHAIDNTYDCHMFPVAGPGLAFPDGVWLNK